MRFISPFRYPGGKSWLYPKFKTWFKDTKRRTLVELFAGGGSIGLKSLEEGLCDNLVMIELDPSVAAVWKTILGPHWKSLVSKIESFDPVISNFNYELANTSKSQATIGWQALLKNRLNHGGIIANGSAPLRKGERGRGLGSRWYPETLISRINRIRLLRKKIQFHQADALGLLQSNTWSDCAFFVDPPYPVAGRRLYSHFHLDHVKLLTTLGSLGNPFFATYEDVDDIKSVAYNLNFKIDRASMFARCHKQKTELIITNFD